MYFCSLTMGIYKEFLKSICELYSEQSAPMIISALRHGAHLLAGKDRYNGDPLFLHSLQTARIVAVDLGLGRNSVVAALLHDASRLGLISKEELSQKYGNTVVEILKGMNSISNVDTKLSTLQVDNFRELIISYSTDPRVLLIKIADRLEVMRSLGDFPELKRNKKSWETLHLYAPLAHKLGLYSIKTELEDLAFKHLENAQYKAIKQKLTESEDERQKFIARFVVPIQAKMKSMGLKFTIKSRTKSIYSIWRKMKKQNVPFEGVYDLFAIRIIIECDQDHEKMQCWTAFSIVTDFYTPNPDRMRDWISIPKSNGYESLHSTVLTTDGRWVEVQIRSGRMDEVAEKGVAAHWRYKDVAGGGMSSEQWLERLRSIVDNSASDLPMGEEFDFSVGSCEVFVFTPTGDLRKLPEGATVLDFAFDIHTNVGSGCTGATVNGRAVPIKEKLRSGDVVEIKSSKNQRAKVDWLNMVVTNKAKSKIRQILREELASSATLGKEELERKIKNWRFNITLEEAVTLLCKRYKVKTGLELYDMIAEERLQMSDIKEHLAKYILLGEPINEPKERKKTAPKPESTTDILTIDDTVRGVDYKMARCCSPIFGDDIFGFITVHSGVTIHRTSCPNSSRLKDHFPYRIVQAQWKGGAAGAFLARLHIEGDDKPGATSVVTDLISHALGFNIRSMNFSASGGIMRGEIAIEVANRGSVDMVLHNLRHLPGITRAWE